MNKSVNHAQYLLLLWLAQSVSDILELGTPAHPSSNSCYACVGAWLLSVSKFASSSLSIMIFLSYFQCEPKKYGERSDMKTFLFVRALFFTLWSLTLMVGVTFWFYDIKSTIPKNLKSPPKNSRDCRSTDTESPTHDMDIT